ncbi:MAG: sugar ABC transporter ATP-binding protein [Actinobacteria bacterium]|nr:sugar ABC transporter ATP-binding protein [Actinomycetota bacterium]
MTDDRMVLRATDISKRFGVVRALEGVSLDVGRGEVHALVGENGAGKSTLTRIIGGAERADAGEISFEGSSQALSSPAAALAAGISIVYQHLNLSDELTVAGNLYLGREPRRALRGGVDDRAMNRAATAWLDRLGAGFPADELVGRLSPSDRQLAEIARGLSHDPKLLIMDEPTASLAPTAAERVFAVLRELRAGGLAVIYITHELAHVFDLADRVTVLKDGRNALSAPVGEVDRRGLIKAMVGRTVDELFPRRGRALAPGATPALELRDLTLPGCFEAVTLAVAPGEVVGLGGLVGSGRSGVARTIFGDPPERRSGALRGEILVDGESFHPRGPRAAVKRGIGFVPEDRKVAGLVLGGSVSENISLPQLERLATLGVLRRGAGREVAEREVEALRIKTASLDTEVQNLSGGNQQKVVLAKWLARSCRVLILDEPTPGVDVGAKAEIYALVRRLADAGTAVLLISSDLPELLGLSDRVLVMSRGRIVAELEAEVATEEGVMKAAFDGMETAADLESVA